MRDKSALGIVIVGIVMAFSCSASVAAPCEVAGAAKMESSEASRAALRVGDELIKALNAQEAFISSREWDDDRPMGDQMNATEAAQFSATNERVKALMLAALLESKRERDIRTIARMFEISAMLSQADWQPADSESEDGILFALIVAMREWLPDPVGDVAEPAQACDLESAFATVVSEKTRQLGGERLDFVQTEVARLQSKYNVQVLDRTVLSAADLKYFDETIAPVFEVVRQQHEFIKDVGRLQFLERTSERMLASWRTDLYERPGEANAVGQTLARWGSEGSVPEWQQTAVKILTVLNEEIPPAIMESWEEPIADEK